MEESLDVPVAQITKETNAVPVAQTMQELAEVIKLVPGRRIRECIAEEIIDVNLSRDDGGHVPIRESRRGANRRQHPGGTCDEGHHRNREVHNRFSSSIKRWTFQLHRTARCSRTLKLHRCLSLTTQWTSQWPRGDRFPRTGSWTRRWQSVC